MEQKNWQRNIPVYLKTIRTETSQQIREDRVTKLK